MRVAVYPGTFDPITNGHADIICRCAGLVDRLIVGVAYHSRKEALFTLDERIALVERIISQIGLPLSERIVVLPMEGLLIDFAHSQSAQMIIRGLRAVSDFEYEFQMTAMNHRLQHNIETVFLMASEDHHFVSSRLVKEIARLGGDISSFVETEVARQTLAKYRLL